MLFVSRKKYDRCLADLSQALSASLPTEKQILDENMLNISRRRSKGLEFIDRELLREDLSNDDRRKLLILKKVAAADACYSNYITTDNQGRICIDVQQIPWTADERKKLLSMEDI